MQTSVRGPFSGVLIQQLGRLFQQGTAIGLTEGELLERFVREDDESAFEVLIARHGPMVLGVCRRLLRDPNDVDDAFQATFLVLVRKAGTLRRSDLLGNWLYGVAHRVATRARVLSARRLARAPLGTDAIDQVEAASVEDAPGLDPEATPWLHEEVRRLPEKYRVPVLLCYFEGLTHEQAAARLGWRIGTVKGRMSRARDLLRKRLSRRGVAIPAGDLILAGARVAVPESLPIATLQVARSIVGAAGASVVSVPVTHLVDGVVRAMILTHAKPAGLVLLVAGCVTTGLVLAAGQGPDRSAKPKEQPPATKDVAQRKTSDYAKGVRATPKSPAEAQAAAEARNSSGGRGGRMPMRAAGGLGGAAEGPGTDGGADDFFSNREGIVNGMTYEARMRLTIAELGSAVAEWDKDPKNEPILKALDQPLKLSFPEPTPLDDILKYIKSSMANANGTLPIYLDPTALAEATVTPDPKVVIDLEGVPLKTSLRLVLKQLGLAYCVRDGVLIISTVEGVREELAEAVYELMGSGKQDEVDMRVLFRSGLIRRGMGMGGMGTMGGGPGMM